MKTFTINMLAEHGRKVMPEASRETMKTMLQGIFKQEGISWTRDSLRGFIGGVNFSILNDVHEEVKAVGAKPIEVGDVMFSKERQRAFIALCVYSSILDDWNKKVEEHMKTTGL